MTEPATPPAPLFMMTQVNVLTGDRRIIYGHATANVMTEFWEAYADADHLVEIQPILQGSMMATPRPPRG